MNGQVMFTKDELNIIEYSLNQEIFRLKSISDMFNGERKGIILNQREKRRELLEKVRRM